MQINDRTLLTIAVASGIAAIFLVYKLPGVAQVSVYTATRDIRPGDLFISKGNGANIHQEIVGLEQFQESHLIPATMGAMIEGHHAMRSVKNQEGISVTHLVPVKVAPGKKSKDTDALQTYFVLSHQLKPGQCAIAVSSDALVTLGQALEPGDVIDIVLPGQSAPSGGAAGNGQETLDGLVVLAVGGRARDGWITTGDHTDPNPTIVIGVPEANAQEIARMFAAVGYSHPRTVLHKSSETD
jgi:Flp pilus assembly protein CpaB